MHVSLRPVTPDCASWSVCSARATLVIGVVLLFNPVAAAHTLALLIEAGRWSSVDCWEGRGGVELRATRGSALVLGAILVIAGVLAAAWPKPTLFTVALVIGLSLIVHGGVRVGVALLGREELPNWGWLVLAGAVNIVDRGDRDRLATGHRAGSLPDPRCADRRVRLVAARVRLRAPLRPTGGRRRVTCSAVDGLLAPRPSIPSG